MGKGSPHIGCEASSSLTNLTPFRILAILDAWSRLPIAAQLFTREPQARDVARVVRQAVVQYGAPRVLVSDRAKVFRSQTLRRTVRRLRIQHRFGAVGQPGSIALLERFWRTLKALSRDDRPSLFVDVLERRLATVLFHYSVHRPHAGLGGATPLQPHLGLTPAHAFARPPARDRPTRSTPLGLSIRHLDDERRWPILVRAA